MTCPHPKKVAHPSKAAALAVIAEMYRKGRGNPDLNAYQCGNHWHVGHNLNHFKRRIRTAVRVGSKTYAASKSTRRRKR